MIKNLNKWSLFLLTLLITSCGVEQFGVGKQNANINTNPVTNGSTSVCSDYTLIRPPVDLLFIWDNSTSTRYISNSTKQALSNTINYISDRFDYQVLMAPLLGSGNSNTYFFSKAGLMPSGPSLISKDNASQVISSFPLVGGSAESGAKRARDLILGNISNGVFRKNAYTVIILMSNGDDSSFAAGNRAPTNSQKITYANSISHDLLCLKGNYQGGSLRTDASLYNSSCSGAPSLDSSMMRFLSIAPSSVCESNFKPSTVYRTMSQNIAANQGYVQSDYTDICNGNYANIFDQVNSVIADQVVKHRYNYWPVAGNGVELDPSTIVVTRDNGSNVSSDSTNGFSYLGKRSNQNTRYYPSAGEPYTGHMIKLNGSAEVTFPSCLHVNYQSPKDYYGYCHIPNKPLAGSVDVFIDGQKISTSKWTLVTDGGGNPQYSSNKNIKITSPSDFSQSTPGRYMSGYFVKLNSDSVYSNSQSCNVTYNTAGN